MDSQDQSAPLQDTVDQRRADKMLLIEMLTEYGAEERLVTEDELLTAFLERAEHMPSLTVSEVERALEELPDPRFEGPDSRTVALEMERIKEMEKTQPGSAPDPDVPGLRETRRRICRRELLQGLLTPHEAPRSADGTKLDADTVSASGSAKDDVPGISSSETRKLTRDYAETLLKELAKENEDVANLTSRKGSICWYYKPQMSTTYARILSTASDRKAQVAGVVRDCSRDYPRPVPLEMFEYPPFLYPAGDLQQCLHKMADDPEYQDIRFTESSVGTIYLYSSRYLDETYAAFLADREDVGVIDSP